MNKTKVSAIVTVYNTEKYLKQCLDSIINQTLKEIEIICVNDGSTDNSLQILEEYAKKNPRIKIINQENQGQGTARNNGLKKATGEYISFVDADDWISLNAFENLYKNAKTYDSDIVMCPTYIFDDTTKEFRYDIPHYTIRCLNEEFDDCVFNHEQTKDFMFKIPLVSTNKIYRNTFLKKINAKFPEDVAFSDVPFFFEIYLKAGKISLIRDYLYYYRMNRKDSIMSKKDKVYFDIVKTHELSIEIFKETNNYNKYKIDLRIFVIASIMDYFTIINHMYRDEFFQIIKKKLKEMEMTGNEIEQLSVYFQKEYNYIINSNSYKEYKQLKINGNKKPKVSVIIPVYTVEKYLKQCLDSVINQTLRDIEIICVNDGSTDNSLQILEEYAKNDPRIQIISQENQGLGAARNTGLKHVNGEYVSFVDSDDWIDLNTYEKLYKNAQSNNSDIVITQIIRYNEENDSYIHSKIYDLSIFFNSRHIDFNDFNFDYTKIKPYLLNRSFSTCIKFFKTDFLKSYEDFYFPQGLLYEDVPFHVQTLLRANKISYCPSKLYFYRTSNSNSIMNASGKTRGMYDIFTICNKVKSILINEVKMEEFKTEFNKFKIIQLIQWLSRADKSLKNEFFGLIKDQFEKMNIELEKLNKSEKKFYLNVLNSNSYDEYILPKNGKNTIRPKVSVIIPLYNTEKDLKQCMDSIINQTLSDIEIICVNDGSTDNSLQILEEYAKNDPRIQIISQENQGQGAARNRGLGRATGEYVSFVDSDDWIDLNTYEKLYKNAISNNSDMVMTQIIQYNEENDSFRYLEVHDLSAYFDDKNIDFNDFLFDYTKIKPYLLNRGFSPCTKFFKTDFLKSYDNSYFPEKIICEDVPFQVQAMLRANKISYCPSKLYFYRISNDNSTMNASGKNKKVFDIFKAVDKVKKILIDDNIMSEFKNEFIAFKIVQLMYWFDLCDESIKEEFFKLMKKHFSEFDFNNSLEFTKFMEKFYTVGYIKKSKLAVEYHNVMSSNSYYQFKLLKNEKVKADK